MRLIDANLLEPDADYDDGNYWAVSMAQIQGAPTIEERKNGKWSIKTGELAIWDVCSECGKMVFHKAPFYSYCPNCGCRMVGDSLKTEE